MNYHRYEKLQKHYLGEPVDPAIYKQGSSLGIAEYSSLASCENGGEGTDPEEVVFYHLNKDGYICDGTNKVQRWSKQIGPTINGPWSDLTPAEYINGDVIETDSYDCGGSAKYEWVQVDPSISSLCVNNNEYYLEKQYSSTDGGETWSETGETRRGSLYRSNSSKCENASEEIIYNCVDRITVAYNNKIPYINICEDGEYVLTEHGVIPVLMLFDYEYHQNFGGTFDMYVRFNGNALIKSNSSASGNYYNSLKTRTTFSEHEVGTSNYNSSPSVRITKPSNNDYFHIRWVWSSYPTSNASWQVPSKNIAYYPHFDAGNYIVLNAGSSGNQKYALVGYGLRNGIRNHYLQGEQEIGSWENGKYTYRHKCTFTYIRNFHDEQDGYYSQYAQMLPVVINGNSITTYERTETIREINFTTYQDLIYNFNGVNYLWDLENNQWTTNIDSRVFENYYYVYGNDITNEFKVEPHMVFTHFPLS